MVVVMMMMMGLHHSARRWHHHASGSRLHHFRCRAAQSERAVRLPDYFCHAVWVADHLLSCGAAEPEEPAMLHHFRSGLPERALVLDQLRRATDSERTVLLYHIGRHARSHSHSHRWAHYRWGHPTRFITTPPGGGYTAIGGGMP